MRKYKPWHPGPWAKALPPAYFTEMTALVNEVFQGAFSEQDIEDGYDEYIRARNVFGRMELCQTRIMPWLTETVPHLGTVLEIGCGTGSATVPLAAKADHVYSFDLSEQQAAVTASRCALLDITNVTTFAKPASWIDDYLSDPTGLCERVDTIVCYALFEHLTPAERIKFLIGAWRHLPQGGRLVIIETPNRLYFFDWHSSQMPFQDQLPPEIAFLWNAFSPRNSIPAEIRALSLAEMTKGNVERLYRFGRGASFHEFYAALGPENFAVINKAILDRQDLLQWNERYIALLDEQLQMVTPPPHFAFAQPSLDLILEKTGESRLSA